MTEELEITGPLEDRLVHKSWKVRLSAYEELEKFFKETEENDPKWLERSTFWKNILSDNNAAAQEKGLDALIPWIDRAKDAVKQSNLICSILVEKCLGGRNNTKNKAIEAFCLLFEIEAIESVISNLLKGTSHKVPKICVASLFTLREIFKLFGSRSIDKTNLKNIVTAIPTFFDHADSNVRTEAFSLVIELYKWYGDAILKNQLEKLRPAQVKELEAAFTKWKESGEKVSATRFTRSQQAKMLQDALVNSENNKEQNKQEEIDPYDMMEPVNILSKISNEWFENISSPKWQIRKEQLENLINLANVPRLQNGDYNELTKTLKKILGDANVIVVSKAVQAIGLLCKGLRKDYISQAKTLFPHLLEKFKEKKLQVTDPIHQTLDIMFDNCFTLNDVIEDIQATLNNKVPKIRADTISWLNRCLNKSIVSSNKKTIVIKQMKPLATYLITALDDSSPEVREAASMAFGSLVGVVSERSMQPYINKLDKIKLAKVKEFFPKIPTIPTDEPPPVSITEMELELTNQDNNNNEKNDNKSKSKGKSNNKKLSLDSSINIQKQDNIKNEKIIKTNINLNKKNKINKNNEKLSNPKKNNTKGTTNNNIDIDMSSFISLEDALIKAKEIIPNSILELLENSNWKQRLQGMEELKNFVDKMELSLLNDSSDILIRFLQNKPGWKESNIQVLSCVFNLIAKIVRSCPNFNKQAAIAVIPGIVEKLSDIKLKIPGIDCLEALAEFFSPQFVYQQLYSLTSKHKNPKIIIETLGWICQSLEEFGITSIQIKPLIDYLKECFESSNANIRSQAIKTLVTLRKFVGSGIRDFIHDIKPALLSTIDEEFSKVADQKPPKPTKTYKEMNHSKNDNSSGSLPREDISSKITSNIIKQLNDNNWKTRKEAIEQIQQIILAANKLIQPNLGNELMPALKARLSDTNKNLITIALDLLGLIASSMGPPIEKYMKIIIPSILTNFSDNKKNIRDATSQTLDIWVSQVSLEQFFPYISPIIESQNSRKDVLAWLVKHFEKWENHASNKQIDISSLLKMLVICLEDKNSEVRHFSETILKFMVQVYGNHAYDIIKKQSNNVKPASKLTITPIIENLKTFINKKKNNSVDKQQQLEIKNETLNHDINSKINQESKNNNNNNKIEENISEMKDIKQEKDDIEKENLKIKSNIYNENNLKSTTNTTFQLNLEQFDIPTFSSISLSSQEIKNSENVYQKEPNSDINDSIPLWLENVQKGDETKIIDTLKMLCYSEDDSIFMTELDKFVDALTYQLHKSYENEPISIRLYKYILNSFHKMFSKPLIAKTISRLTLERLIKELLIAMSDQKFQNLEEGQFILRALNVLLIQILDSYDSTSLFIILLEYLLSSIPKEFTIYSSQPKLIELIIKCLLKLTKSLSSTIEKIDISLILNNIHIFLETHPPPKWKGHDDMPLRTIKTILNEIVSLKGIKIHNYLMNISTNPSSPIISYVNLMLKAQQDNNSSLSLAEIKMTLTDIFKKIGDKETSQQGLLDLYNFKQKYPTVDIQPHLQKTSEHFQAYIKRGLQKIEQKYNQKQPIINENQDPNNIESTTTSSYIERLRKLQKQYSQTINENISGNNNNNNSNEVIKLMKLSQSQTNNLLTTSTDSSVTELRERLNKIRNTISVNNITTNNNNFS